MKTYSHTPHYDILTSGGPHIKWWFHMIIMELKYCCCLVQQFSTGVLQEFLRHAIPDSLVRGTDLFLFSLSNKKMPTAKIIIAICCD